jgi:D-arabinose 1-dehydrogenase-like Zn-dependent alcohol dehydrogenase
MLFARSTAKEEAAKALGAKGMLVSSDKEAMKAAHGTLNGIIDTVSAPHDVNDLLALLQPKGKLIEVGLPPGASEVNHFQLVQK